MMKEADPVRRELAAEFPQIALQNVAFGMHQRIERENEVHSAVRNHLQGLAVVHESYDVRTPHEAFLAGLNAGWRDVHDDKQGSEIFQVFGPTPVARGDFENRESRHEVVNARV